MVKILDREVGPTGYGLMGFTWRANPVAEDQAFAAMKQAIKNNVFFWNGGEFYGDIEKGPNSLTLLNKYFTKYPEDADKVVLSIKGGYLPGFKQDGSPEGIRASINNCLRLLPPSVKKIDVFECARVDKRFSIEEQVKVVAEFVQSGQIGGVGLSEVKAETIRRAAAATKIAAVEIELSIWETFFLENGVMETCAELGIPVVAYSPLGRGFLTGQIKSRADIPEGDFRLMVPRFTEENFPKNLELVDKLNEYAQRKGCTAAQLALGWVRGHSGKSGYPSILPIPGATTEARVSENSTAVELTQAESDEINAIVKSTGIAGDRYPAFAMEALAQ